MLTRRKVMGWLGAMLGAGATGAQAALDQRPPLPMNLFKQGLMTKDVRPELARSATYQYLVDMFVKLGEAGPNRAFGFALEDFRDLWGQSLARMLMELPCPTYEHGVFFDTITWTVLIMRPDPVTGYYPFDQHKRLR